MAGPATAFSNGRVGKPTSHFTDKQIAYSVKHGKAIEVLLSDGSKVLGFVFGMDTYHWGLVTVERDQYLVHKSAPRVKITDFRLDRLFPKQARSEIEDLVLPFREHVMREYFRQASSA